MTPRTSLANLSITFIMKIMSLLILALVFHKNILFAEEIDEAKKDEVCQCENCGEYGFYSEFCKSGRFCGQQCSTLYAAKLVFYTCILVL